MEIVQNAVVHVKETVQSLWLRTSLVKTLTRCFIQTLLHNREIILHSRKRVVQVSFLYIQKVLPIMWHIMLRRLNQCPLLSLPVVYLLDLNPLGSVSHALHGLDGPIPLFSIGFVLQHCIDCSFPSVKVVNLVAVIQCHHFGSVPSANEVVWVIERDFFS